MAALALAAAFASLVSAAPSRTDEAALSKRANNSLPLILANVQAQVDALTVQLNAAIAGALKIGGKVDVTVVTPFLLQLKGIIVDATVQITAIATLGLDVILASNGSILTVAACAQLLATVFIKIVAVLQICLSAVLFLEAILCLTLIIDVILVVVAWLQIILNIVVGIQGPFIALIPVDVIGWIQANGFLNLLALIQL